jgi:RimJ/RimL family protein N-acetyltransferase
MTERPVRLPLALPGYCIREHHENDADGLCRLASSDAVWRHLGARIAHPFTPDDARSWLARIASADPVTRFAIAGPEGVGPEGFCGGIGIDLHQDPSTAHDGEIGFWVGRPYWNRGLGTAAVRAFTAWARAAYGLQRLSARVLATNVASARVLLKCGYRCEGTLRLAVRQDEGPVDLLLFGHLASDGLTERGQ